MNAYEQLIQRLDDFIRKYYKNRMAQGALYVSALVIVAYLAVITLEYFGHFGPLVRTVLFFGFILTALYYIATRIVLPALSMLKLGKHMSHEQAADIIGKHFPDVDDRLLNTLQLHAQLEQHAESNLLQASIQQRMQQLTPVPFLSAIDVKAKRKYLKVLLPGVAVLALLFFITPSFILKPTDRLLRYNEIIEEEAPFQMILLNDTLQALEHADYKVRMKLEGDQIPDKVYIELNGQKFQMVHENGFEYSYLMANVQSSTTFVFYAGKFHSKGYELEVLNKPRLTQFQVALHYPSYLHKEDEVVNNTGDLLVPEGTTLQWKLAGMNTEQVVFESNGVSEAFQPTSDGFEFEKRALENFAYAVLPKNARVSESDALRYQVNVIADARPSIAVREERDSMQRTVIYFTGDIQDDYGLTKLVFAAAHTREGKLISAPAVVSIPFETGSTGDQFFHAVDFNLFELEPGDEVQYFFEVWDNDGVHGPKSTRSMTHTYVNPTQEQLDQFHQEQNESIKEQLEASMREAQKLQKELQEMQRDMIEKNNLNWQDQKHMEELMQRQKQLEEQVQRIQEQTKQRNQEQKNEELAEKQKQLEKLMQEMLTPEMKKMMEEMQKLMNEMNRDELRKEMEKMDLSNEDLEKELDRALEQFKQLEVEEKLKDATEKLKELSQKQEQLANNEFLSNEEKMKEQEQLNKEFEDVKKELEEAEKLNKELENPQDIPNTEQQQQEVQEQQNQAQQQLSQNKKSGASKSQKQAAQKMQEMAQQLEQSMQSNEEEQHEEDMDALRALLENIITVSFDQEALMNEVKNVQRIDPKFKALAQRQFKLKEDARMIEDSLFALSKRVPEISAAVNREINQINADIENALKDFPDGNIGRIGQSQQSAMTGFNNLALLLDDALKQMQQNMQSQSEQKKPGKGKCNKPGGKGNPTPSAGQMKKMQESMQKQLEALKKQGKNQGKNNSNGNPAGGQDGQSKELAQMAAKQAALRKMMEEKANELNEDGSGNGNELREIAKEMEKLQRDIVNNQITEESLRRQNDIMIRLLKAEEAERTREMDNERKSREAINAPIGNPKKYEDFLREKKKNVETLRSVSPNLKPYYREKTQRYFQQGNS